MPAMDPHRANALLAALPRTARERMLAQCNIATLVFGDVLYEPGDRITHVYFPIDSLTCLLTLIGGHLTLEVGMIGPEGMLGIPLALNVKNSPVRALIQGAGEAWRMPAAVFLKENESSKPLRRAVFGFTNALMQQIAQSAACNRFHQVDARLARWLLMTRDRVRALECRDRTRYGYLSGPYGRYDRSQWLRAHRSDPRHPCFCRRQLLASARRRPHIKAHVFGNERKTRHQRENMRSWSLDPPLGDEGQSKRPRDSTCPRFRQARFFGSFFRSSCSCTRSQLIKRMKIPTG
jgi:CRP-like cAMP-binding protein